MTNRSDYAGNAGTDENTNGGPTSDLTTVADVTAYFQGISWWKNETGITYAGTLVTIRQIPDGTSKTYFVGEKSLQPRFYAGGGPTDNGTVFQGHDWDIVRGGGDTNTMPTSGNYPAGSIDWRPLKDEDHPS